MPISHAPADRLQINTAGQSYMQTYSLVYLGGSTVETPDAMVEITLRKRACGVDACEKVLGES